MQPRESSAAYRHPHLVGADVHTEEDMVAQALQNASRVSADSSSRKWLRRAIEKPSVLDYLERCVFEERERRV